MSLTDARQQLGALVRRALTTRERITITDHGYPAAVLVNAAELADLEEELAIAQYRARQATGALSTVSHAEARRQLGLIDE